VRRFLRINALSAALFAVAAVTVSGASAQESGGSPFGLKKSIGAEAGGVFTPYGAYTREYIETPSDDKRGDGWGGGMYARADLVYADIALDWVAVGSGEDWFNFGLGLLGKYPVGNDLITVSPLLGFGLMYNSGVLAGGPIMGGRVDVYVTKAVYLRSEYLYCFGMDDDGEDRATSFKAGGGLDIGLGKKKEFRVRPELTYNWETAAGRYNDYGLGIKKHKAASRRVDLRVGIGYRAGL